MITKFKVFVVPRLRPDYTEDQAKLAPGALNTVHEKELEAVLETEAEDLAFVEVTEDIVTPDSDLESFECSCHAVRLDPLKPLDPDIADLFRREYGPMPLRAKVPCQTPCWLCDGLGFVLQLELKSLLCRCPECNRFRDEQAMFQFIYAKLTTAILTLGKGEAGGADVRRRRSPARTHVVRRGTVIGRCAALTRSGRVFLREGPV